MTPADIAAGLRLCRSSGWNQLESDWSVFFQLSPRGCRVAEKNGAVVGTVATVKYQDRFSWLSMVLVDPHERRAGIGARLVEEGLAILQYETCVRLDATASGRRLYQLQGFVDDYSIVRLTVSADNVKIAPTSRKVRRIREQDLPAIFDQDRRMFGADREPVLRSLFSRSPECAWIAEESKLEGYCFGRPGFLYHQLGPIVARDQTVACHLVSHCLMQASDGRRFGIDAPEHSLSWLQWLTSAGFSEERPFVRMHRGENRYPGRPEYVFGITGPEFG